MYEPEVGNPMPDRSPRSASRSLPRIHVPAAPVPLTVLAAFLLAPAAGAQDFDFACPTDEERQVVELINAERAARGHDPLELDVRLGASASRHSEDMSAGCFLSHTGSDGSYASGRVNESGYGGYYAGEVAGAGQVSPPQIVTGWMNSPGHFAIIMDSRAKHIGVAHVTRSACWLQGYGFRVADFWTADLGWDPAPHFDEQSFCSVPRCQSSIAPVGEVGTPITLVLTMVVFWFGARRRQLA